MQINVSQQLKAPVGTERTYKIDDDIDILGLGVNSRVAGTAKLIRTNRGILVEASISTQIPEECSRCLKVFDLSLSVEFEEEFFPVIDIMSGIQNEKTEENSGFFIDDHHILDLSEPIRQNVLLAIPINPLCKPDCSGLCPRCGKNLNSGQCKCGEEDIDPRWAKLLNLKSSASSKNIKEDND